MPATLKSRFPKIIAELPVGVQAALKHGAEGIAEDAKHRAPVQQGDLRDAIHVDRWGPLTYSVIAGDGEVFYGHMVEHGTSHSAPEPFLVPALEAGKSQVVAEVSAVVRDL